MQQNPTPEEDHPQELGSTRTLQPRECQPLVSRSPAATTTRVRLANEDNGGFFGLDDTDLED